MGLEEQHVQLDTSIRHFVHTHYTANPDLRKSCNQSTEWLRKPGGSIYTPGFPKEIVEILDVSVNHPSQGSLLPARKSERVHGEECLIRPLSMADKIEGQPGKIKCD